MRPPVLHDLGRVAIVALLIGAFAILVGCAERIAAPCLYVQAPSCTHEVRYYVAPDGRPVVIVRIWYAACPAETPTEATVTWDLEQRCDSVKAESTNSQHRPR